MLHGSSWRLKSVLPYPSLSRRYFFYSTLSNSHHQNLIDLHQCTRTNDDTLDAFDHLLRQCTTLKRAKRIHTRIIVTGRHRSAFLASRLVWVYGRFGLLTDAQAVFRNSSIECFSNLILCNSILRANVSHGCSEEALRLYIQMRKLGVNPDGFTFPLVIRACASMGNAELCKVVHCHVVLLSFQFHLHIVNELIGMYGKLGWMNCACQLFDRMPLRSSISWNTLVSGFAFNSDSDGAVCVVEKMQTEGLEPNPVTWTSLLSAHARCGKHEDVMQLFGEMRKRGIWSTAEAVAVVLSGCPHLDAFDKGKEIHGYVIKCGFHEYIFVRNSLICVYGKYGNMEDAKLLFTEMKTKNLVTWNALISSYAEAGLCDDAFEEFLQLEQSDGNSMLRPNVISWSAVIGGFASQRRGKESLELFRRMQKVRAMPNSVTIAIVLSVCAELAALVLGREIHGYVIRQLMDKNICVGNGLINMYAKCGSPREGHLVFERIECRDLISWNSMIMGFGMHGFGESALLTFNEMVAKSGLNPDRVTFVAVLSACSHAGLVLEGRKLFDEMTSKYDTQPQLEHYACMVDLLGRAGLLQEASELVKMMPMEPNACVLGAIMNSCRMHRNTEVAEEIASRIFNLNSEMTGSYMQLSNIYAACGKWEDSARVRMSAKTKGLKKIPGQSWIEVEKKVYMFSAGNSLQLRLEDIYGILEDLSLQMESEGYIPNKSLVPQDVDRGKEADIIWTR